MRHVSIPELLDSDLGTSEEVHASLADLRLINRWFGGISTSMDALGRIAKRYGIRNLSLLDVGAGSGDVAEALLSRFRQLGIALRITLLDRNSSHLPSQSGMQRIAGDAFALPFRNDTFDVVSCALLAHHFEPGEIARFVEEALRVARVAVVINDLRRGRTHLLAVYAGFPLYRSRITRHDAPASVRRAYTCEELRQILKNTSAASVEIRRHYFFRMSAIAWKTKLTISS